MIFAARISPTPKIQVRLVQLSSTASWMLRSRSSSCRSRRRTSRSRSAASLRRGPCGAAARAHAAQHTSSLLCREVLRSSARKEISKQCMQAVESAGALLDEVFPSFGEHSQYLGVLFLAHIGKTLVPKRGQGNVKGVHLVVLAGVACGEKTGSGRELGGYVHNPLSGGN